MGQVGIHVSKRESVGADFLDGLLVGFHGPEVGAVGEVCGVEHVAVCCGCAVQIGG